MTSRTRFWTGIASLVITLLSAKAVDLAMWGAPSATLLI